MQRQKAQLKEQMKLEDLKVLEYIKEKTVCLCCLRVCIELSKVGEGG